MNSQTVVTELVIDARAAVQGSAQYVQAMEMAAAADARAAAYQQRQLAMYTIKLPASVDRVLDAYRKLQASTDPVIAAQNRMETHMTRSMALVDRAVLLGVTTEIDAARTIERLREKQIVDLNRVREAQLRLNATPDQSHVVGANDNGARFRRQGLIYQGFDIGTSLAGGINPGMVAIQQGPQIVQMYAGQGGVNAALKDAMGLLGGVASKFGPIIAVAALASAAIGGMTYEINAGSDVAVSFGNVASAAIGVVVDAIGNFLQPAINQIAPWFASAWDLVVQGTKMAGNLFIAGWLLTFDMLSTGVGAIPDLFIIAGQSAANGFLSAVEQMVREALVAINDMLTDINGMLPEGIRMPLAPSPMSFNVGHVDIGGDAAGDRLGATYDDFVDRAGDALSRDYLGEYFDAVKVRAVQNALNDVEKAAGGAGSALKNAAKGAIDPWKGMRDVTVEASDRFIEQVTVMRDLAMDFGSSLSRDLQAGVAPLEALGNAFGRLGDKLLDMAMNQAINSLFENLAGGGSTGGGSSDPWGGLRGGGGGGGGWLKSIFSLFGFANGGPVNGPGTSTSDSIPAWLSDGEFVVNAAATRAHRPLLEAMNQNSMSGSVVRLAAGSPSTSRAMGTNIQIIDQRTNAPAIEREESTGPNGEQQVRFIVRDEIEKYDATMPAKVQAKVESMQQYPRRQGNSWG